MKIGTVKIAGLVIACLACPAMTSAQLTAPREQAQIEFGPVSLYPSLQIVDAGRDENVFNDNGAPKSDYTFTLASRALVVTRLGLNELMFSSGSDYVWFRQYAAERGSNATYSLRFNLSASRFKPYIGASRTRTRARPSAEIDARARRIERTVLAGTNFNLSERTAITATAQYEDSAYEHFERFRGVALDTELNMSGRSYAAGVRYAITPLTTLQMTGNYGEDLFTLSHRRDAKRYSVTPSLEFSPDAALRGKFTAGYEVFKPNDPELFENRGMVFDGALNWSLQTLTTFDLQANRNVNYSYQETEPFYLQTGARLTVSQRIFWTLELVATGDRRVLSYRWHPGVTPVAGAPVRNDTVDVVSGGVSIPLKRGFRLVLGMEQARRHSKDLPVTNYNRRRLISTITVGH